MIFDYPTLRLLETHLCVNKRPETSVPSAKSISAIRAALASGSAKSRGAIYERACLAISGTDCMLPHGAAATAALQHAVSAASNMIGQVPASRWDGESLSSTVGVDVARRTCYGAFVDAPQLFDHVNFSVSLAEAEAMDPQQRLVL